MGDLLIEGKRSKQLDSGPRRKAARQPVVLEQRLDFRQQRTILAAALSREGQLLVGWPLKRGLKDVLHAVPAWRGHHVASRLESAVMRRYSHARAVCHSRVTVEREIDRTSATSCSERPPK